MALQPNVGTVDRTIRILVGLGLLSQVFVGLHNPWFWLGLVPLITGITGFCPAYFPFGIRTCPLHQQNATK